MRVRMLEATPVAGVDRFKGQVGDVPDNVGRRLVQLGKAEEVGDDEDDEPAAAPRVAGKGGKGSKGGKADQAAEGKADPADGADQAAEGKADGEA